MTARQTYWTVVICAATIMTLTMGLRQSFGLFLKPMSVDLGFGRETFGMAVALQNLMWGAVSPFAGAAADKYGSVRVVVAGALFYAAGLAVMATSSGGFELMAGNLLIGLALGSAGLSVLLGVVGQVAPPEKRSMALGLTSAGGSFGQFAVVPFGHLLIDASGWSMALVVMAAMALLIVPLARGVAVPQRHAGAGREQTLREALDEAFRHRGFWLLTAGFFVCGFHVVFVATHLPAFLADRGLPTWVGAWTLALVGLFNIVGSYGAGWLGGLYSKKNLLALIYLSRAGVFLLFILMPLTPASVLLFGAGLGLLWLGTVPLTSGLVAHIFGPRYMSMLYGIVFFSHQVGSFMGAWLGGYAFDATGSYDAMWWLSVALGLAAAALHWPIRERPVPRLAVSGAAP